MLALIVMIAIFEANIPIAWQAQNGVPITEAQLDHVLTLQVADNMFFWVVIFLVKSSFLATYWTVFSISRWFRTAWWMVAVYTFLTFWILFLAQLWACGTPSSITDYKACADPSKIGSIVASYWWYMALNVSGDFFIMVLPIRMLMKLRMSTSQRLGLTTVFALSLIDIFFDILRTVYNVKAAYDSTSASSLGTVFTLCEPAIAVMVCTLPSYRSLLRTQAKRRTRVYQDALRVSPRTDPQSIQLQKSNVEVQNLVAHRSFETE